MSGFMTAKAPKDLSEMWVELPVGPEVPWKRAENRGGMSWIDAPTPSRWHRCRAQTSAVLLSGDHAEFCACGAIRRGGHGMWRQRNSKRWKFRTAAKRLEWLRRGTER